MTSTLLIEEITASNSLMALLWVALTLAIFYLAKKIFHLTNDFPLLHPVLTTITLLITCLSITNQHYQDYMMGAQFIDGLLGPAVVAMAIPLYKEWNKISRQFLPLLVGCTIMVAFSAVLPLVLLSFTSLDNQLILPAATKSITTPVAIAINQSLQSDPSLATMYVVMTGVLGAAIGKEYLSLLGVKKLEKVGFALGLTSHGIGTARAFQLAPHAGAFSALAMIVAAVLSVFIIPLVAGFMAEALQ